MADREPFDLPICLGCEEWAIYTDLNPLNCFHLDACERAYELGQEKQLEAMQDDGR